ncbi:hypothetical protein BK770_28000 [Bacillus thuringiensis serovar colmeri]|nr:hypothetical protein BK760_17100 [Bacillus thuringiensis serovar tolworthi]OTZ91127.1 hypothetical protein BK770_28000 [Bacillus thuringiensis serovar colmeri]
MVFSNLHHLSFYFYFIMRYLSGWNYYYEYPIHGVPSHAHQLKNLHYPQVSKNVILSKKLARKDDIFYESFNSR